MKLLIILSLLVPVYGFGAVEKQRIYCDSSREFIVSLEFLRDRAGKAAGEREVVNRKLAEYVSSYCSGAAYRFIKVVRLFEKLNLGVNNAIEVGKKAVKVEDSRVDLFVAVFKRLYLKGGFDLNPNQAMLLSKEFLKPSKVNPKVSYREFDKLSDFCESEKGLAQNRFQCASLVRDLVMSLEDSKNRIADSFINTYELLTEDGDLGFTAKDAVVLSRDLIKHGPNAIENFRVALEYALKDKGLNLNRKQAVDFAKKMASRSVMETELEFKSHERSRWWMFW